MKIDCDSPVEGSQGYYCLGRKHGILLGRIGGFLVGLTVGFWVCLFAVWVVVALIK